MEAYAKQVASYLFAQSWQIALLAVVVGLISFALRHRSAHVRYLLWLIVLAKCLVPPYLTVPLAVLPERSFVEPLPHPVLSSEVPAIRAATPDMSQSPSIENVPKAPEPRATVLNARGAIVLVWLAGVFLFLLWAGVRAVRYTLWLRSRRSPLPDSLKQKLQESFVSLKPKKLPRIWLTKDISQPFVWGLFRGSVYLPVDFAGSDVPQHHRTVLAHELSHVARFDAAVNVLQVAAQAIYWFHPFVWWMNRRIRQEREKCCDEMAVVQLNTLPEDYTNAIVDVLEAERGSAHPIPSLAIVGSIKDIEERIRTMMRPGKKFYKRPSLIAVLIVLSLALLTVPTALVLTAEAQEKTPAAPPPAPTAKDKAAATAALFRAIEYKNVEKMRLAINQGADLEGKNKDAIWLKGDIQSLGCTPLYVAAGVPADRDIRNDSIRLLLEAGANPNTRAPNGQIPLHFAAYQGGISSVDLLVSAGSDVNTADKKGRTPAIIAFEVGYFSTFDLIVARGATVSTDLMSAYKGNLSRVRSLIKNGKAQERFEQDLTLMHAAAAGGHTAIVELLLTNDLDVRSQTQGGYTALHYAVAGNHREVAELLLAKGADVNTEPGKQTPLHWAIGRQHKDMIAWLLARGANPNADGGDYWGTPLHWAVWWWDVDSALLLVSHGGDIHLRTQKYPHSPLFDTVVHGNPAMAEALVTKAGDTKAAKWAPLHAAAASGDRQAVEDLLAKGADVNAKSELGASALHTAAVYGHKQIAELLIEKGADVNATAERSLWDEGMTALHGSCIKGQKGVAELLIARGADVNAKTKNGYTPLHIAATGGHKDVAEVLIAKGADVNAKDNYGRPPLSLAKNRSRTEVVELLRKYGAKDESSAGANSAKPTKSLHQAAADGDIEQVKLLIRNGADVNATVGKRAKTPLIDAVSYGHADIVEVLLANGAKVDMADNLGRTPLIHALVTRDSIETVRALISAGADVNKASGEKLGSALPLNFAIFNGKLDVAKVLLDAGADIDAEGFAGYSPLHYAAMLARRHNHEMLELLFSRKTENIFTAACQGDLNKVKTLIDDGTDVNVKDEFGVSLLHWAAAADSPEVAEFLIAKGADVNAKSRLDANAKSRPYDRAPLMGAHTLPVIELLISKGADVNAQQADGWTKLHVASINGDKDTVEFLIRNGADANIKINAGIPPLWYAVCMGRHDVIEPLIAGGADINFRAGNGRTPLSEARRRKHADIVDILLKHGAQE